MQTAPPKQFHYGLFSRVVLGCYVICGATLILHTTLRFIDSYREATTWTVPYLGWDLSTPFMFSLLTLGFYWFQKNNVFPMIIIYMAIYLPFTLNDLRASPVVTGNPYLDHAPGRAWFTVGLPIFWIVVMGICWYIEAFRAAGVQYRMKQQQATEGLLTSPPATPHSHVSSV